MLNSGKIAPLALAATAFVLLAFVITPAQTRWPDLGSIKDIGRIGDAVNVQVKVGEITLESIDFRTQTASLNVGLDIANGFIPVSLKDFDYRLRLANRDVIEGTHHGTLKVGGRRASRVNLPLTVHLRSIPGVAWSAFTNRGQLRYDLDSAFTLPFLITENASTRVFPAKSRCVRWLTPLQSFARVE